jgi:hypothetical protein
MHIRGLCRHCRHAAARVGAATALFGTGAHPRVVASNTFTVLRTLFTQLGANTTGAGVKLRGA